MVAGSSPCCTLSAYLSGSCPLPTLIRNPCNSMVHGTLIYNTSIAYCTNVVGGSTTTFVYPIGTPFACNTTSDCGIGEVCTIPPYSPVQQKSFCAVEAVPGNCGKTFNAPPKGATMLPLSQPQKVVTSLVLCFNILTCRLSIS